MSDPRLIGAVAAILLAPLLFLRGRTLRRYYAADLLTWLLAWIIWRRVPGIDPYLGCVALAVVKFASLFVAIASGGEVRWSANRAALLAAVLYALAIPSMLRVPIDGDEPFYLLITESLTHDADVDLANQYQTLEQSATRRTDLRPQQGDPVGQGGEIYSRHEPFLSLLLIPGYLAAGLPGAVATIALFGVLLVRSTLRWMDEEGIDATAQRAVFPFFAFGPPVIFYATRIWPEVPAAFFFVEALRGIRADRPRRWLAALFGLVMLKLRFVVVAATLVATTLVSTRRRSRALLIALAVVALPLLVVWLISGSVTNVHTWRELLPAHPREYVEGLAGLLADGASGILFQAPFYLAGLFAIVRWRSTPRGFRVGIIASILYILLLLPRMEWFGGWAPPLRYLVFLMPVLALGAAAMWERISRGFIAAAAIWTAGLAIHGLVWPWRKFHIANGENNVGEWLSTLTRSDFSRLFPSFVRPNAAAWIGLAVVIALVALLMRRTRWDALFLPLLAIVFAAGFVHGREPGVRVEFEDAHVQHEGGELFPELYTVIRVAYRGGWILEANDSLSFLAKKGSSTIDFITGIGATIEIGGHAYELPAAEPYQSVRVTIPHDGRVTLRCLRGAVNLDRMTHD